MKPIRIFLDTEFTSLDVAQPKIISIGLATEDGRDFYREFTDTYKVSDCSQFCKDNVLTLLWRSPDVERTAFQVANEMWTFLEDLSEEGYTPIIVADYATDFHFFYEMMFLFANHEGSFPNKSVIGLELIRFMKGTPSFRDGFTEHLKTVGSPEHHALYDAQGNRAGYNKVKGS